MFIAELFTIAKTWKQPKCPLRSEWINTEWSIPQAIKKNEIVPPAATWVDLEIVILSEASRTEKDK